MNSKIHSQGINIFRHFKFAGMVFHATGIVMAIIFPVTFTILRLLFSSYAMSWCISDLFASLLCINYCLVIYNMCISLCICCG